MNPPEKVALPTDQELVLKVSRMPANCNAKGDIFGGCGRMKRLHAQFKIWFVCPVQIV